MRLLAQGRRQPLQQLLGIDAPWLGFAPHQLAEGEGAAPALQLFAPLVVQAPAFVEHEKHLETGIAEQHIGRLLAGRGEVLGAVGDVQALQQALAHPTLAFPFARIGEKRIGLFGLDREQAQEI
ncbi:hypothetical protein D3C81_1690760 [compost metagenome]